MFITEQKNLNFFVEFFWLLFYQLRQTVILLLMCSKEVR